MIPDIKLHLLCGVWNCLEVTVGSLFWCSIGVAGEDKVPGDSSSLRHLILQQVMKDSPMASCNTHPFSLDGNCLKHC